VHHTPSGPPSSARLTSAPTRAVRLLSRAIRIRGGRWPLAAACGFVATVAVLVPVVLPGTSADGGATASVGSPAALSAADAGGALVQLGVDGDDAAPRDTSTAAGTADTSPAGTATDPGTGVVPDGTAADGATADRTTADHATADRTRADRARADGATADGATADGATVDREPATTAPAPESSTGSTPTAAGTAESPSAPTQVGPPSASRNDKATAPAPAGSPSAAAAPTPAGDAAAEAQVLALVNQQRAAAGCGNLVADAGLSALARAFSADMRDRHFFSHTDPDGLSPFDRGDRAGVTVLAENIAYGQPDPASVMTAWMNSPGHRANILNCAYSRIGVGVADGSGGPWWTQDFA
jgi:uncharacterized protein YkwD